MEGSSWPRPWGATAKEDDSKLKKKKANITSSARLSLLPTLQDLFLEFFCAVFVLLVAFLTQFSNASEKVVDILSAVGVSGRSHGRTRASPALIRKRKKRNSGESIKQGLEKETRSNGHTAQDVIWRRENVRRRGTKRERKRGRE